MSRTLKKFVRDAQREDSSSIEIFKSRADGGLYYLDSNRVPVPVDTTVGDTGLYQGSGTVPTTVVATLTDTLSFTGGTTTFSALSMNGAYTLPTTTGTPGLTKRQPLVQNTAEDAVEFQAFQFDVKTSTSNVLTWNLDLKSYNATITLTENVTTFNLTNMARGEYATLKVIQDAGASGFTLALPAASKVVNTGAGAITLSTGANAIDILTVFYDGTNYFWSYGLNFT